jgi:uracil-DNA glycosylase family 4
MRCSLQAEPAVGARSTAVPSDVPLDCPRCPRLVAFRDANRVKWPDWFNAPVPSFGPLDAELLIVGLAPGLQGANRTGRPFTGDFAGLLLYSTLLSRGLARGTYGESPDDGLELVRCRITNAVRCVPPKNKPEPSEIALCAPFLAQAIAEMPRLKAIVALGQIAFAAVVRASGLVPSRNKFTHGGVLPLASGVQLFSSYHCSRYNTNTGKLTAAMFESVIDKAILSLSRSQG